MSRGSEQEGQIVTAGVDGPPGRPDAPVLLVTKLVEQDEVVLVLDDFHRLSSASARESFARMTCGSRPRRRTSSSSEVLGAYEPEMQTFMLRTSVLERLCAGLCDAVLGHTASAGALA